jgi:hypothetical protein
VANKKITPTMPNYGKLGKRINDIGDRFLTAQSVVDVVLQHLLDTNTERMHAELAATLRLARDHISAANDDLDRLSIGLARPSGEAPV